MRAHILAIAVITVVAIVSFAAGRALTDHLLAATSFDPGQATSEAAPVSQK